MHTPSSTDLAINSQEEVNIEVLVQNLVVQYSKKAPPLQSFLFNLPLSITIGQFQIADLMFLKGTRLTDADFYIFKLNPYPITYDRGMNVIGPSEFGSFYPMVTRLTDGRKLSKGFVV